MISESTHGLEYTRSHASADDGGTKVRRAAFGGKLLYPGVPAGPGASRPRKPLSGWVAGSKSSCFFVLVSCCRTLAWPTPCGQDGGLGAVMWRGEPGKRSATGEGGDGEACYRTCCGPVVVGPCRGMHRCTTLVIKPTLCSQKKVGSVALHLQNADSAVATARACCVG